jgi:hypothetical protein
MQIGSLTTIPHNGSQLNVDIRNNLCQATVDGQNIMCLHPSIAIHLALQILSLYANPAARESAL